MKEIDGEKNFLKKNHDTEINQLNVIIWLIGFSHLLVFKYLFLIKATTKQNNSHYENKLLAKNERTEKLKTEIENLGKQNNLLTKKLTEISNNQVISILKH